MGETMGEKRAERKCVVLSESNIWSIATIIMMIILTLIIQKWSSESANIEQVI